MKKASLPRWIHVCILLFCLAINAAGNSIAFDNSYRFLYLDMIGTFISAVLYGPVGGFMVGALTNSFLSIFKSPHFWYFTPENILGGIYWGILAERNTFAIRDYSFRRFFYKIVFLGGVVGGAVCSILGGIIQHYVFHDHTKSYSSYVTQFFMAKLQSSSIFIAMFSDLLLSVQDKIFTCIIGVLLISTILRFFSCRLIDMSLIINYYGKLSDNLYFLFTCIISLIFYAVIPSSLKYNITESILFEVLFAVLLLFIVTRIRSAIKHNHMSILDIYDEYDIVNDKSFYAERRTVIHIVIIFFFTSVSYLLLFLLLGKFPYDYYHEMGNSPTPSLLNVVFLVVMFIAYIFIDFYNCARESNINIKKNLLRIRIYDDIDDFANKQTNVLTNLSLSWRNEISQLFGNEYHLSVNELERFKNTVSKELIEPFKESVLRNFKNLRTNIDDIIYNKLHYAILDDIVIKSISNIKEITGNRTSVKLHTVNDITGEYSNYLCSINMYLLESVLINILDNSYAAIDRQTDNWDDLYGEIIVRFSIETIAVTPFFKIEISDNGGGFSKDIINKIYIERIKSTKNTKADRDGLGTSFVSHYIKDVMGGRVTAQNVRMGDFESARTTIFLPLIPSNA